MHAPTALFHCIVQVHTIMQVLTLHAKHWVVPPVAVCLNPDLHHQYIFDKLACCTVSMPDILGPRRSRFPVTLPFPCNFAQIYAIASDLHASFAIMLREA